MVLTQEHFEILVAATGGVGADVESERSRAASGAAQQLERAGLLHAGRITDRGTTALDPYRVDNAVIMAAGMSTRFAPLSYEMPKGLLTVRGEVLIERQIRQLHEADVHDITVVVGYMAEHFEYLADEFGVRIVVNPDYRTHNNNSTLWRVRSLLRNTYVCSSDNYYASNPFRPYEYRAYYSAEYVAGPTSEWCLQLSADDLIEGVSIGGADSWVMLGHVYFDSQFSRAFVPILERECPRPPTFQKLWESLYLEHLDGLRMWARRYGPGVVSEFDSMDELAEFDPECIDQVESPILDNITSILGCRRADIHGCEPLSEGLTNLSFKFFVGDAQYVYRHPGVGTEEMIDRSTETEAQLLARELGLDTTFIHEDPRTGWKLSRFVPDARSLDPTNPLELRRAMELCKRLHDSGAHLDREFDFFEEGRKYERLLARHGPILVPGYAELRRKVEQIKLGAEGDGFPLCLNHNDFFPLNILVDRSEGLELIDWEYAGMADVTSDLATFTVCAQLSDALAEESLEYYLGRVPDPAEKRHFWAYVTLAGWCWYVWSLVKEAEGDDVGEWLDIYHGYATRNVDRVIDWYGATSGDGSRLSRVSELKEG